MSEDFFIDDINPDSNKKRINGGGKGKRGERNLTKLLNKRFGAGFSRTVGSGARTSFFTKMPLHAMETFSGDIVCPEGFSWVIECKYGYDDIDLFCLEKVKMFDSFLNQVSKDSNKCGRKPMLLWRKTRKNWIAFVRNEDLPSTNFENKICYFGWTGVLFSKLLTEPDSYFIK
jgi:Holliday junction resolvase